MDTAAKAQDETDNKERLNMRKKGLAAVLLLSAAVWGMTGCAKTQETVQTEQQTAEKQEGQAHIVEGQGSVQFSDGIMEVTSGKDDRTILVDEAAGVLHNSEAEIVFDPKNDNADGMYGIIFRYTQDGSWTFIGQDGHSAKDPDLTSWVVMTNDGVKRKLLTDGQRIYKGREVPYTLKVRLIDDTVTIYLDHAMIYSGQVDGMTDGEGMTGLCYVNESGADIRSMTVSAIDALKADQTEVMPVEIASKDLKVQMDPAFPRVIGYELTAGGETLSGQNAAYHTVEINNTRYTPEVTSETAADGIRYHLNIADISVSFDVTYKVTGNVLRQEIVNVQDEDSFVKTINFPNQSIVSMNGSEPGAQLRVNNYRQESVYHLADRAADAAYGTTSLAVLSCDTVAASINNGNINNRQEIAYQTANVDGTLWTGLWTNEFQYRGLDDQPIGDLWTEVAVTGDRNGDGSVDYQDGAIARRDDIGTERVGAGNASDSMSMIAMDVGSLVQYPFLRILDNIKKFSAGTDGFGQMILIKGYQSEGHDASHPDYANISQRAGGEQDFKTLLNEAGKYGAKIGLHINHTEAYPEARQYSDKLVADVPGWTWYDQSYHIIRENDLMDQEQGAEKRLEDLAALTDGKVSMIYVDTYQDSRWQAERLTRKINDLGWMLGTEYSEELVKRSTWSHTINSTGFNYDTVGNLVRFIDNETKDIFACSPLFRGLENRNKNAGFFGWQTSWNYDVTMENFYTRVLPQKYLANFPVNRWVSANKVMLGSDNQVVTEMVAGVNQISRDGHVIARGNTVFIPWDPIEEKKIYHWNENGGSSVWELPDSWEQENTVKVFLLTDEGRTNMEMVPVEEHKITLQARPRTAYVIYKGSDDIAETDLTAYNWGEGSPVKDMGFDSHTFGYGWEKSSTAGTSDHIYFEDNAPQDADETDRADNAVGNTHVHVKGAKDAVLTQTMEGLVPGETYSASVFMEANEGRKLTVTVTMPDGTSVSNYADDFTALYGAPHNDRYGTHYQRVKLTFTQPEGYDTAEIRLEAAAGQNENAWANFDNVRVTAVGAGDTRGHEFFEDFEHVDQAYGPFICTTKADQCHLAEANGDWTKDVIDGRYSLKIRGNTEEPELGYEHLRTVSHRVRLLPNTDYTIGLDYLLVESDANEAVLNGDTLFNLEVKSDKAAAAGDEAAAVVMSVPCKAQDYQVHHTGDLTFTTGDYDDYYIDLLDSTFTHEFVIDNLYVDR